MRRTGSPPPRMWGDELDFDEAALLEIDALEQQCSRRVPLQQLPSHQHAMPPPQPPPPPPLPQPFLARPPQASHQQPGPSAWAPHATYRQQLLSGALMPAAPTTSAAEQGAASGAAGPQHHPMAEELAPGATGDEGAPVRPEPQPFDPLTIGSWIFPTNQSERRYQFEISSVAVRHNTLVSLPTGLGKTLIASVVMYNFHRWFPTGRCLFLAPTKPLVHQQVSAVRRAIGLVRAQNPNAGTQARARARACTSGAHARRARTTAL